MLKRLFFILLVGIFALPMRVFALTPNDTDYSRAWYLPKMGLPAAWDFTQGSESVVVAVLDTGVDIRHPDLAQNIWINTKEIPGNGIDDDRNGYVDDMHGWNFVDNSNDPTPQYSSGWTEAGLTHGTVIAGIIGAVGNNVSGIAGINWKVKIMPIRILDSQGVGDPVNAAQAIDYAVRNGARVLNFSFVTTDHSAELDAAIARAARAGVLVVAAAGNNKASNGDNLDVTPMYPVCSDAGAANYVLGVAATDINDKKSDFSNYGANCIDIAAPGTNIISTQVYNPSLIAFNSFTRGGWNGTSVASPMVAGAAALLLAANPGLSRETLMQNLLATADPIDAINPNYRGELGSGRLNVERAIRMAVGLPVVLPVGQPTPAAPANQLAYIIEGAGPGGAPEVRVYSPDGVLFSKFMAYAPTFKGGVRVAAADVTGDGVAEIITGAGPGGGPHVRVFNLRGDVIAQFFAYGLNFRGGVSVATGDTDGDGKAEIITGAGPGGGPHVRVFDVMGTVKGQFFALDGKTNAGVNVASGDIDADGKADIVAAPASRAGSQSVMYYGSTLQYLGAINFLPTSATGGVSPAVADVTGDARGDIILARTTVSGAITVITSGITPRNPFTLTGVRGLAVGALDINSDGRADILAVNTTGSARAQLVDAEGKAVVGFSVPAAFATGAFIAGVSTGVPK